MSFRRSNKPTTRRSASVRNSSHNTVPGLASYNRPRSLSFLSTASSPSITSYSGYSSSPTSSAFHSFLGVPSSTPSLSNYSNYGKYNTYSNKNHYTNGYTPSSNHVGNYGGLSSGYGSVAVPSKALSALNIMPYSTKIYDKINHDYLQAPHNVSADANSNDKGRKSRSASRNSSFNRRSRSQSGMRDSGMGSRSLSLTSLNSEGYASGSERSSSRGSRLGSASDLAALRGENGELDYKKMYEQAVTENDRLRDKLRKSDEDLKETKQTLEKLNTVTSKNSLSELEKRERRAMERKLSEMEEELKQLQKLKAENERLRAENRALTRVVSKLTNSAGK